jgi:uncharacterized Tic20 family protein
MNEQNLVPRNARWWAIACYLSGLLYLVVILLISIFAYLWLPKLLSSQSQNGLIALAFNLIPGLFWLSLFTPLFVWKLAKNVHPFAVSAGKTSWNLMLNLIVLSAATFLLTIFLISVLCGLTAMNAQDKIVDYILLGAMVLIGILATTHILFSLIGARRAGRGELSNFPVLRFLKS